MMRFFFPILFLLLLAGCIEEIEFERPEGESALVVDGVIVRGNGVQSIRLSWVGKIGSSIFSPVEAATVFLASAQGKYPYSYISDGVYELPAGTVSVETGQMYWIELTIGNVAYRSEAEIVPLVQPINGLSYVIRDRMFVLEVENTTPESGLLYLKWNLENIYSISELFCSPFSLPKTCYIRDPFQDQLVRTYDATALTSGSTFRHTIVEKEIDFTFGNPQSFHVIQQSVSEKAFDFWDRVNIVANPSGSVFDPQPAQVRGNVINLSDPSETVLGYVAAVSQDSAVLFTTRGEFYPQFPVLSYCGEPGFPHYSPECCDCLILEHSSTIKPPYW
jgi:hypothetical protein